MRARVDELAHHHNLRNVIDSWDVADWESRELCYARKAWELVHFLHCDTQDTCISKLDKDRWIALQDALAPIGPSLATIREAYWKEEPDSYDKHLMNLFEKWYKDTFDDETPWLGYEFATSYLQNFWEGADEVLAYLENPDWIVFMIASY